jgi:hypothetical protein
LFVRRRSPKRGAEEDKVAAEVEEARIAAGRKRHRRQTK